MKVRMIQHMSGHRGDGSRWPAVGEVIEVSDAEGMELCRSDPHSTSAIAVPVMEDRAEKAVAPEPVVEKRVIEPVTGEPGEPVKRGPGRPPGSKSGRTA